MVRLHGPWGAGKSSVLNLLRQQLQLGRTPPGANQEQENATELHWIVVDFNGTLRSAEFEDGDSLPRRSLRRREHEAPFDQTVS